MANCTHCGTSLPAEAEFCPDCNQRVSCGHCGAAAPPGFRFCGQCGKDLEARDRAEVRAERRQLTVMFCDMVGSTELSERLDPEDLREVIQAYQQVASDAITMYGGHIAQYLGDGILAYFGYPTAHENDSERAVRAALDIIGHMANAGEVRAEQDVPIRVRIGIHTGNVVVGDVGAGARREQLAIGRTPNVAARLQGLADPGQVVISDVTRRLVMRTFEMSDLGQVRLKGVEDALCAFSVDGLRSLEHDIDETDPESTDLISGRQVELLRLKTYWDGAARGIGGAVLLSGEAGIGKSTLVRSFRKVLSGSDHSCLVLRCSPFFQGSALQPVRALLHRMMNFFPEQDAEDRLATLRLVASRNELDPSRDLPLLASVIGVEAPDPDQVLLRPMRGAETIRVVIRLFASMARDRPLLLVVEDLHWADPSTRELVRLLPQALEHESALVLATARPEYESPGTLSSIPLLRLDQAHILDLVLRIAGSALANESLVRSIVDRSDGVPLFAEELARTVFESSPASAGASRIPVSLQDSLMARLDRLGAARETAQTASAVGRQFSFRVLLNVAGLPSDVLESHMGTLVSEGFLIQRGDPPDASYLFRHALIRDTAYASMLRRHRRDLQKKVLAALTTKPSDHAPPELIAHHAEEAGLPVEAAAALLQAAGDSISRSAYPEALAHSDRGLALLEAEDAVSRQLRSGFRLVRAASLAALRGYADEAAGQAWRELIEAAEGANLEAGLLGLFSYHIVRHEFDEATAIARKMHARATETNDSNQLVSAATALGITSLWTEPAPKASQYFATALSSYDAEIHRPFAFQVGQDMGVVAHAYQSYAQFHAGDFGQAESSLDKAYQLAVQQNHPHSISLAKSFEGSLLFELREPERLLTSSKELIAQCDRYGFTEFRANAEICVGWSQVALGDVSGGLARVEAAFAQIEKEKASAFSPMMTPDALRLAGHPERALAVSDKDLEYFAPKGEHVWLADMLLVRAHILLDLDEQEAAENTVTEAARLADWFGSRALRLRASLMLARMAPSAARRLDVKAALEALPPGAYGIDVREAAKLLKAET